jgi:CRISPR-associated protein Cmr1
MIKRSYQVRFTTPAFLGNAQQEGQWRTPPFKALLRQWWRVASGITDECRLRQEEARLFGAASDEGSGSHRSLVRIRLGSWEVPESGKLPKVGTVCHPEVDHPKLKNCPDGDGKLIDAGQYLGYGPIQKANAAIQAGEPNTLRVAWPDAYNKISDVLQFIQWFGTLGGRSRNGWGSLTLEHESIQGAIPSQRQGGNGNLLSRIARPIVDCLSLDWPHALGTDADGQLLVWCSTGTFPDWREAMRALAKVKIGFRRTLPLDGGNPLQRHLLAYPVTHHSVGAWGNQSRLANQLRFKVAKSNDGKLTAYAFHLPCGLPTPLAQALGQDAPSLREQAVIWNQVHTWLDNTPVSGFRRI